MKFSPGDWTHDNFMDIFFEVEEVVIQSDHAALLRGYWFNLVYAGNPWLIEKAEIDVLAEDFKHWHKLESRIRVCSL